MKLRLRSFETKETLKLEIPNPCTLDNLRELISQKLPSSSQPPTIHFSLNRKDEITPASPEESIQSIGITSGDLIHFTTNPNGFSTTPQLIPKSEKPQNPQTLIPKSEQPQLPQTLIPNSEEIPQTLIPNSEEIPESMEIDEDENSDTEIDNSFSVPSFLRKVFTKEVGHDTNLNNKLLSIAIHAVLLESGFVELDPVSKSIKTNNFDVQRNLYLATYHYTLPEIITNGEKIETVKIKFQNLGKYCKVYGSLTNGPTVHSVLLDESKLVPFLNVVWANCGNLIEHMAGDKTTLPETEVFEFWKKTKDKLALPLLIDLCEKTGLVLPPCFMRLPTELKLKIVESISGKDVANVSCVCSELRYLCSSEELWKQKYVEEFGNGNGRGTFKERFKRDSESRKRRNVGRSSTSLMRRRYSYIPLGPPHFPRIIGGDYDLFVPNPGPLGLPGRGIRRLRFAGPHCNLDGV